MLQHRNHYPQLHDTSFLYRCGLVVLVCIGPLIAPTLLPDLVLSAFILLHMGKHNGAAAAVAVTEISHCFPG